MNDGIDPQDFSLQYIKVDQVICMVRDVDNSQKPGKLPGCERDVSGCKALLISPKCF